MSRNLKMDHQINEDRVRSVYEHPRILRPDLRAQAKLEVHIETTICLGRVLFISGVVNRLQRYRGYDIPPLGPTRASGITSDPDPTPDTPRECVCLGIGFKRGHTIDCDHSVVLQQSPRAQRSKE